MGIEERLQQNTEAIGELVEAVLALTEAMKAAPAPAAKAEPVAEDKPKKRKTKKKEEQVVATQEEMATPEPLEPEMIVSDGPASNMTIEEIRAKLTPLAEKPEGLEAIQSALGRLGVEYLSDVGAKDYGTLLCYVNDATQEG